MISTDGTRGANASFSRGRGEGATGGEADRELEVLAEAVVADKKREEAEKVPRTPGAEE